MLDTALIALLGLLLGLLLALWWADRRQERQEQRQAAERAAWEVERLKLLQALAPGVTLVEVEPRTRRYWSDEEEAAWERARAGLE